MLPLRAVTDQVLLCATSLYASQQRCPCTAVACCALRPEAVTLNLSMEHMSGELHGELGRALSSDTCAGAQPFLQCWWLALQACRPSASSSSTSIHLTGDCLSWLCAAMYNSRCGHCQVTVHRASSMQLSDMQAMEAACKDCNSLPRLASGSSLSSAAMRGRNHKQRK